ADPFSARRPWCPVPRLSLLRSQATSSSIFVSTEERSPAIEFLQQAVRLLKRRLNHLPPTRAEHRLETVGQDFHTFAVRAQPRRCGGMAYSYFVVFDDNDVLSFLTITGSRAFSQSFARRYVWQAHDLAATGRRRSGTFFLLNQRL